MKEWIIIPLVFTSCVSVHPYWAQSGRTDRELTHSTGHPSRLNRHSLTKNANFGSHEYSKEELVAEMGSAFLSAEAGIDHATLEMSASYISSWLRVLKNDSKLLLSAAGQAQKATDFILNRKFSKGE